MSIYLMIILTVIMLYIFTGVLRTGFSYIKRIDSNQFDYPIGERIVDTLWLDVIYTAIHGKEDNDIDPYDFDSLV